MFNDSSISEILIEDTSNINEDFSTQLIINDSMITDAPIDFPVDLSDNIQQNNNKAIFLLQAQIINKKLKINEFFSCSSI